MLWVKIVLCKDKEIRAIELNDVKTAFSDLVEKVRHIKNDFSITKNKLYWIDKDGDEIIISSNEEFLCALNNSASTPLKIYVTEKTKSAESVEPKPSSNVGVLHPGIICDGCGSEIRGIRYKCLVCNDYDLCSDCDARSLHCYHDMARIINPIAPGCFYLSKIVSKVSNTNNANKQTSFEKKDNQKFNWILEHISQHLRSTLKILGVDFDISVCDSNSEENPEMKIFINTSEVHNGPEQPQHNSSSFPESDESGHTSKTILVEPADGVSTVVTKIEKHFSVNNEGASSPKEETTVTMVAENIVSDADKNVKDNDCNDNCRDSRYERETSEDAVSTDVITEGAECLNELTDSHSANNRSDSPDMLKNEWAFVNEENPGDTLKSMVVPEKYAATIDMLMNIGLEIDEKIIKLVEECDGNLKKLFDAIYGK